MAGIRVLSAWGLVLNMLLVKNMSKGGKQDFCVRHFCNYVNCAMKYFALFALLLFACSPKNKTGIKLQTPTDTFIEKVWDIENGDTVSGHAVHIKNGDTIFEDFGINPSWNPKN